MDYSIFDQVIIPITAAIPDVASLLEQINTDSVTPIQLLIIKMTVSCIFE